MFSDAHSWLRKSRFASSTTVFGISRSCDIDASLRARLSRHLKHASNSISYHLESFVPRGAAIRVACPKRILPILVPRIIKEKNARLCKTDSDLVVAEPVALTPHGVLIQPDDHSEWPSQPDAVCVSVLQFTEKTPADLDLVSFEGKVISELGVLPFDEFVREVKKTCFADL